MKNELSRLVLEVGDLRVMAKCIRMILWLGVREWYMDKNAWEYTDDMVLR